MAGEGPTKPSACCSPVFLGFFFRPLFFLYSSDSPESFSCLHHIKPLLSSFHSLSLSLSLSLFSYLFLLQYFFLLGLLPRFYRAAPLPLGGTTSAKRNSTINCDARGHLFFKTAFHVRKCILLSEKISELLPLRNRQENTLLTSSS